MNSNASETDQQFRLKMFFPFGTRISKNLLYAVTAEKSSETQNPEYQLMQTDRVRANFAASAGFMMLVGNGYYDRKSNYAPSDLNITVTVYYEDRETGEELFADGEGKTKGDAWFNFFKENSNVCFNDIIDYEYE